MNTPRATAIARATFFAIAVAALGAGCSGGDPAEYQASWKRVELPGFSVMLPPGEIVGSSTSPMQGKHQVKLEGSMLEHFRYDIVRNGAVSASWSSQVMTRDEWTREYLPVLTSAMSESIPGMKVMREDSIDEQRWMAVVGTKRVPIAVGAVSCDDSFQIEITYAHYHDAGRQIADLRKIISSVECNVSDGNRARPLAATRLPEKFGTIDSAGLQTFQSLDGESLAINFTQGDIQRDEKIYLSIIKPLLAIGLEVDAADLETRKVEVRRGTRPETISMLHLTAPGHPPMYVGTIYCEAVELTLISLWTAPQVSDELALERLDQIGCPGSPSTPSLTFESLEAAAATR